MATKPRISVVTVCYNASEVIEKTLRSVSSQTYDNIEYLIIDGASKDDTLDVVDLYSNHVDYLSSEPDKGLYDAMNKGIFAATGDFLIFMNADDVFADTDVVADVAAFIEEHPDVDAVFGDSQQILDHGTYTVRTKEPFKDHKITFSHQAVFIRVPVLRTHPFDLRFPYAADYEQLSHFYLEGRKFAHIDRVIARVEMRGGTTFENNIASAEELYGIIASRGVDIEAEKRKMIRHKKMVRAFKRVIPKPLSDWVMRLIAKYYKPL